MLNISSAGIPNYIISPPQCSSPTTSLTLLTSVSQLHHKVYHHHNRQHTRDDPCTLHLHSLHLNHIFLVLLVLYTTISTLVTIITPSLLQCIICFLMEAESCTFLTPFRSNRIRQSPTIADDRRQSPTVADDRRRSPK